MSDNQENNALQEVSNKVVITAEDCAGAAEFWTQFDIPMPAELDAAFKAFAADPTIQNQNEVKLQITKAIGFTDHEALKDEMFKEIVEECRNVTYDMSFEKDLESTLSTEDSTTSTQAVKTEE
jgi:hypothetical protein